MCWAAQRTASREDTAMTQTLDSPPRPAQQRAETWLSGFEQALHDRDVERAAGMFAATSFWRDLVAFSWNLTTVGNPDGLTDLLTATLDPTAPSPSPGDDPPHEAAGAATARSTFAAAGGRGRGLGR